MFSNFINHAIFVNIFYVHSEGKHIYKYRHVNFLVKFDFIFFFSLKLLFTFICMCCLCFFQPSLLLRLSYWWQCYYSSKNWCRINCCYYFVLILLNDRKNNIGHKTKNKQNTQTPYEESFECFMCTELNCLIILLHLAINLLVMTLT